jgi:hypothetical protein
MKKKTEECTVNWDKVSKEVDKFCKELDRFWNREEKKIALTKVTPITAVTKSIMDHEEYIQIKQLEEVLNGKAKEGGELNNFISQSGERNGGENR